LSNCSSKLQLSRKATPQSSTLRTKRSLRLRKPLRDSRLRRLNWLLCKRIRLRLIMMSWRVNTHHRLMSKSKRQRRLTNCIILRYKSNKRQLDSSRHKLKKRKHRVKKWEFNSKSKLISMRSKSKIRTHRSMN
jgi:hypothetical protein